MRIHVAGLAAVLFLVGHAQDEPGMELFDGRLSLDGQVWSTAHLYRYTNGGLSTNDATFERAVALAGLTGRISRVVSMRAYFDVGGYQGGPALDMYVDLAWRTGFGLTFGQFLPPVGFDHMTTFIHQPLVNTSLMQTYTKPNGGRDIGAMGIWRNRRFSVAAALVNGAGPNIGDNNNRKDLCARFTAKPLAAVDAVFAFRGYYGWPDWSDTSWISVAAEAHVERGPLELQAEIQNHSANDGRNNAAYLQAVWSTGRVRPAARFDLVLPRGEHPEWMFTGGVNVQPIADHLRVMLDCSYRRDYQSNWTVLAFLLRLQAWL
jgi:hypothetical protein